ncbi:hypothetical protein Btru_021036 [Bulinus truncatus]|nr:hypothetical protein Btru_021036 [Bulinus truncatus]
MSDVGEDDGKESDWIREVSDDSDTEIPGGLSRKYYSQYIAGAERQAEQDEEGDPLQWTGSDTGLKKQDSPIISNMDHYHVGPEFEENCQPWTSGEPGPGSQGAHRSSSEVDHNANHLVNIDYRGGEAFCDSDILSSDQSLSDFEQAEHRWSSSESSRKSDAGHQRIVQRNERGVPRSGLPVFSRSAETARAHMDQKQPAQRPDRFYARRLEIRRTRAPSDQCIGEKKVGGGLVNRRYQIKIKGSKSCTTECEVLRPGSEKLYPCPDKTRFTNLYEEILRSDECSFFTDEDDNPEEDYSDFADDDGPVSEITGLDTSESKSERVTASRISARTESPGESLRDGAVPGGKDNSSPVVELTPLRIDEPHLSPILPVSAPIIEKFQAKTDAGDSNDDTRDNNTDHRNVTTIKTKAMCLNQTLDDKIEAMCLNQTLDDKIEAMCLNQTLDDKIEAMCLNQTLDDKIEAMCLNQTLDDKIEATCFNQTLDDKTEAMYLNQTLDDKTEALCTQETVLNECNENQGTSVLTCLENNGTFNFLNQVLVNAYLQMSKDPEDSSEIQSVKTNVCINGLEVQCIESVKTNVCIKRSEVQYFPHEDSSFSNSYKMEGDSQFDLSENPAQNEPTITKEMNCEDGQRTHFTVECIQKEVQELDHNMADKVDETAEVGEVTGPDVKQGNSTAVHGSSNSAELPSTDAGEGSNDMIGDALAQNEDAASCPDGAAHNPTTTPFPRQYYMSFLTVLRNRKLVNKKVRRPPQKFFRLLQAKSETMNVSEKDPGAADGREASGMKEKSVKMQARHFPKGREVPPGWKPGQYTTSSALSGSGAAPVLEHAAKKKNKKVCAGKGKQHAKGFNNNKKRHVSSEASVQEVESEESFPSRNRRVSYSSESSESTESKHTLGYGERYNPHSEDYSETEQKGGGGRSSCKKSFGQEFESKRQYYEKLTINKRKTSKEDEPGKVELTSQVKFLKTIDEFCSAEDNDNMDYDSYEDTYNGPGQEQAMDSVEYHISLAKYYSGRASNLLAIKSNPPGEPSASCSGVRIRRAANSVPSAIDNERLKSLSVEESNKAQREKVGMWSLNTLYAHKIGISEVPRESSVSLVAPYAEGKEEPVEVSQPVVRKAKTKHGRKRPLDRYRELKLAKFRSVKTSHLEKLAVFESERKVTYLDLLKTGYSTKMSRPMKEQDERKDTASVQRSKSCDNPGGKTSQGQIKVDVSPPIDQENPRRLKLVRFNEPKPLDEDKSSELVDRSEEDTWCYSVNAMLLRANQAMEQQKMAISENNHHFPRPDSAKVVPPVIKPKSSSFLSELLEQDRVEQKKVKQSQQKSKRTETSRAAEDERKRSVDNNGNAADNKSSHGHTMPAGPSDYKEVKPSCAFTNILPSMNLAPNEAPPESPKHSAGILKIKTSASSRKPKDCHPRREQKVFPSDCPASLYFSSNSSQPTIPPKKLLPLRYSAPVDPSAHMDSTWTPVRILKQSMLQRGSSDIQDSPSISIGEKQVIAKPATTTAGGVMSGLSDGYSQESYVDPENSLEDVESNDEEDYPTVLPQNGPPRRSFNLQIIQEEPQYGSSSCYTSSQLELESGSSTNCSLSHGLQCGAEANEGLRSGGYDSQPASEECLNESVENDLNLTYGVSNDPDALCMQGVMGILGKRPVELTRNDICYRMMVILLRTVAALSWSSAEHSQSFHRQRLEH